eukprot:m.345194 g.345194  ORF g.345194 m.345194 type:complete len:416 (-) comp25875_c0_seq1:73-1320(-)
MLCARYYWLFSCALLFAQQASSAPSCNRNGVLVNGECHCDSAWRGSTCNTLALGPANGANFGTIYPQTITQSSWGGTISQGDDGLYHLLVSEISQHCGLEAWQHNSLIRHATSDTIDGVYTPREVVMDVFSHNAACMNAKPAGGPECVLLHVGTGAAQAPPYTNCTGGFTPTTFASSKAYNQEIVEDGIIMQSPVAQQLKANGTQWETVNLTCGADNAGSTTCVVSNPSGWVDKDGTAWINYVLRGDHNLNGTRGAYGFGLAKSMSWKGPYLPVSGYWNRPILSPNSTAWRNSEDSVLYRDSRGDFHLLFHYYGLSNDHGDHGGHAHSDASGLNWEFTDGHAFNSSVPFTNGQSALYNLRQRPHVVLSAKTGEITHLITGVVYDSNRPYPKQCTKPTGMRGPCDHSWTLLQPIAT